VTTYVLIHGAGDVGWYWHLVEPELRARGHDVVAMDLPVDDDAAGLSDYADVVVEAIGDRTNLIVVAQSFGGYVAPMVCDRVPATLLVLVAGMVPAPGESADEMWSNTSYSSERQGDSSEIAIFYHDVDPKLAAEALRRGRRKSETPGESRGRSPRGPKCRRDISCVATNVSSRPRGCVALSAIASALFRTRWTVATRRRSATRMSWFDGSRRTVWNVRENAGWHRSYAAGDHQLQLIRADRRRSAGAAHGGTESTGHSIRGSSP
jgi:pimeloyl-ACP methyl ester carboxylesterase